MNHLVTTTTHVVDLVAHITTLSHAFGHWRLVSQLDVSCIHFYFQRMRNELASLQPQQRLTEEKANALQLATSSHSTDFCLCVQLCQNIPPTPQQKKWKTAMKDPYSQSNDFLLWGHLLELKQCEVVLDMFWVFDQQYVFLEPSNSARLPTNLLCTKSHVSTTWNSLFSF